MEILIYIERFSNIDLRDRENKSTTEKCALVFGCEGRQNDWGEGQNDWGE